MQAHASDASVDPSGSRRSGSGPHKWEPWEDAYVVECGLDKTAAEIAETLGVTKRAVERRRAKLRKMDKA